METETKFMVTTQPNSRSGTFKIVVRDLVKNTVVQTISGAQGKRAQTIQCLQNGHLVIGFSTVRPYQFDFFDEQGTLYNRIESDAEYCWVLSNGLLVEVMGKQTIVKQMVIDFKMPRVIQVYNFPIQWIDVWENHKLVAYARNERTDMPAVLYILDLASDVAELTAPIPLINPQLLKCMLLGATPQGDFVDRVCLKEWISNGFRKVETTPIAIRRQKINNVKLIPINDRYTLYVNHQKQQSRDIGSITHCIIDWTKRQTIWNSTQDIQVIATSPDGYFVYYNMDLCEYFFIICGSSLSLPIHCLKGQKPKHESRFMSNGMFVFHGERKTMVIDIENNAILVQCDSTRHPTDMMILSKCNYRPQTKPVEVVHMEIDPVAIDVSDAKHAAEIQTMMDSTPTVVEPSVIATPPIVTSPPDIKVVVDVPTNAPTYAPIELKVESSTATKMDIVMECHPNVIQTVTECHTVLPPPVEVVKPIETAPSQTLPSQITTTTVINANGSYCSIM